MPILYMRQGLHLLSMFVTFPTLFSTYYGWGPGIAGLVSCIIFKHSLSDLPVTGIPWLRYRVYSYGCGWPKNH